MNIWQCNYNCTSYYNQKNHIYMSHMFLSDAEMSPKNLNCIKQGQKNFSIQLFLWLWIYHQRWARYNTKAYICHVSWIYTCLHLIKNCRKWSDRSSFDQSMNMCPTDLKQKKAKIRKKKNICEISYCVQRLFAYWRQFMEASLKGNKHLWYVYGFNYTPKI